MTLDSLGFIGGGKMAEAILAEIIRNKVLPAARVVVSDVSPERRDLLQRDHGVSVTADNNAVLERAATIFLAVKPQQLDEVLGGIAGRVTASHLFISIAAGKKLAYFEQRLPAGRVVRVMPNLAALVATSANVFCLGARCQPADGAVVSTLLARFGRAIEMPESQFDAVTALSGSGPAFVAHFVEAEVRGGMALGLAEADARVLAYQTLLGTARLLVENRFSPEELIKAVSSAKGTTVAGMDVLTKTTLVEDVARTLAAAATRSRELSQ